MGRCFHDLSQLSSEIFWAIFLDNNFQPQFEELHFLNEFRDKGANNNQVSLVLTEGVQMCQRPHTKIGSPFHYFSQLSSDAFLIHNGLPEGMCVF